MTSPEQKAQILPRLGTRIARENYDELYLLNVLNNPESAEAKFTVNHAKAMALAAFYRMYAGDPVGLIAYESDGLIEGLQANSRSDVALGAESYLKEMTYEQTMRARLTDEGMSDIVDAFDQFSESANGIIGKELRWSNFNGENPAEHMRGTIESAEIGFTLGDVFGNPITANLLVNNSDSLDGANIARQLGGRSGINLYLARNLWISDK